jgi:hypothetical protein
MQRSLWAVLAILCTGCADAKSGEAADVRLLDGTMIHITSLQAVQTIPQSGGGVVYVLGVPIPLDNRIKLSVTATPDPPCDLSLSHVTRIGPGKTGPQAAEYVISADSACHLKAKTKYDSSLGPVQTGEDASLLRPAS